MELENGKKKIYHANLRNWHNRSELTMALLVLKEMPPEWLDLGCDNAAILWKNTYSGQGGSQKKNIEKMCGTINICSPDNQVYLLWYRIET